MLLPIENVPRDYAWGRAGAISALLGWSATDAREAELWLGAHPGSSARLSVDGRSLVDVVPGLPFLLKVLSVGSPLSLQVHPDAEQARDGFDRENAMGVPLDAPQRNYRDPYPKPELIVAVADGFEALCGFRPAAESRADLTHLVTNPDGRGAIAPLVELLIDDESVGDALVWMLEGSGPARAAVAAIEGALAAAPERFAYLRRVAERYAGDPGIAGAVLLHHVVLARGEALYLPARSIHAYLDGIGVELMAPSDNVLRGGLTVKHIEVPEVVRVLQRAAGPVPQLRPVPLDGGGLLYAPDDSDVAFCLAAIETRASIPLGGPAIGLCTDGGFMIRGAVSSIEVGRGDAFLATPDEGRLEVSGVGSLYLAR